MSLQLEIAYCESWKAPILTAPKATPVEHEEAIGRLARGKGIIFTSDLFRHQCVTNV